MTQLDKQDQQILRLCHIEQLSNQKVAQWLGITAPAVSMHYLYAVRMARQILGNDAAQSGGLS